MKISDYIGIILTSMFVIVALSYEQDNLKNNHTTRLAKHTVQVAEPVAEHWNSASRVFDASNNKFDNINLTWRYSDNVNLECDKEHKKRGLGGFGYSVDACAFHTKNTCLIITKKHVNMHVIGHELLHCYQGSWHKNPKVTVDH